MNRSILILLIISSLVVACTDTNREREGAENTFKEQKENFLIWMESFRYWDANAFRHYQSIRMRDKYEKSDLNEEFYKYRARINKMYGSFKLDEFTLSFVLNDDERTGKMRIEHAGGLVNYLDFVIEDGHWRIDQELTLIINQPTAP